jgi:hypothetical protein
LEKHEETNKQQKITAEKSAKSIATWGLILGICEWFMNELDKTSDSFSVFLVICE